MRFKAVALVILLPLAGCSLTDRELKGEISITNGAQNIKLSSVEVRVISDKDMTAFLRSSNETFQAQKDELQRAVKTAEATLEQARSNKARVEAESSVGTAKSNPADVAPASRHEEELKQSNLAVAAAQSRLEKAEAAVQNWPTAAAVFGILPPVSAKTTSDADGRFSVKVPSDRRCAIAAKAQRLNGSSSEEYYWLVWANATGEDHVVLSNNNLMTSEESILKVSTLSNAR
jgi:hypothetical protein